MMKPYSNDLRRRLVAAYETNTYSQSKVAELFGVSLATVKNLLRRHRETGSPDALPHAGGKQPSLDDKARGFVQDLLKQDNDLSLEELCQRVARAYRKRVSRPTMCRVVQALGLPRKKSRSMPQNVTLPESSRRATLTARK
jgi:transposase